MRTRGWWLVAVWWVGAVGAPALPQATHDEKVAAVRGPLEAALRESTGIGFVSFDCEIPEEPAPGVRFTCDAVDEDKDRFQYTIEIGEGASGTVVSVSEPASQVEAEQLALLEAPCREFLSRYREGEWKELWEGLDPQFQKELEVKDVEERLAPVRQSLGALRSFAAQSHLVNAAGRQEVVYALEDEKGPGMARFGLRVEGGAAKVVAFLVTARPGSEVWGRMVEQAGIGVLGNLLEGVVEGIEAPVVRLRQVGDAVEGLARMTNGREVPIRVELQGAPDDFDTNDFRFQVLDVPWLVRRYLVSQGKSVSAVECRTRVAPDGGRVGCTASMAGGEGLQVTVGRRGGDHRILDSRPLAENGGGSR